MSGSFQCIEEFRPDFLRLGESEQRDQGHAGAQCNYGVRLNRGDGLPMDISLVAYYYKLAADQGHAGAQCNYGVLLENGDGVPIDKSLVALYFELAADQGHAGAQRSS
jgi:TPR repeat protein